MERGVEAMAPAAAAAKLPDDIIQCNILPRLPFRELARHAAVCKSWRDLILRDPFFAAQQARAASRASVAVAVVFRSGRIRLPGYASPAAPPDPDLSFLPSFPGGLRLRACTAGVLCFSAWWRYGLGHTFVVVNPATREFRSVPFDLFDGEVTAGLAYDPVTAARDGFDLVVAVRDASDRRRARFWQFSSRDASIWRETPHTVALPPFGGLLQGRPAYTGGRVYWIASSSVIVWYDIAEDLVGTLPLPAAPFCPADRAPGSLGYHDVLGARRGRLRLARASTTAVGVWELADGGGGPARWELLHWRRFEAMPGMICRETVPLRVWSVGKVAMEHGGDEAVCVVVRYPQHDGASASAMWRWQRLVMRCDLRTGEAAPVMALAQDDDVALLDYHSSMAQIPALIHRAY